MITSFFTNFFTNLSALFVLPDNYFSSSTFQPIYTAIENKFTFIAGFQNWYQIFQNTQGQTLNYSFSFMNHSYSIDFSWYEPHRLTIRACFAAVFYVLASLKCLKLLTSCFNINIAEEVTK